MSANRNIRFCAALLAVALAVPASAVAQSASVAGAVQAFVKLCLDDAPEFQELRRINVEAGNSDTSGVQLRSNGLSFIRVPSGPLCYCEVGAPNLDKAALEKAVSDALQTKLGGSVPKSVNGWLLSDTDEYLSVSIESPSFLSLEKGAYAQAASGYDCRPVKGEAR